MNDGKHQRRVTRPRTKVSPPRTHILLHRTSQAGTLACGDFEPCVGQDIHFLLMPEDLQRPRARTVSRLSQDVDYHEPAPEAPASSRVPYKDHAQACLTGTFGELKPLLRPGYGDNPTST